jgi:hypothetical protein
MVAKADKVTNKNPYDATHTVPFLIPPANKSVVMEVIDIMLPNNS